MRHKCVPECVAGWQATRKAHCGACGESFSTPANFDRHRVDGTCKPPTERGMVNRRGLWIQEGEGDPTERFKAKAA